MNMHNEENIPEYDPARRFVASPHRGHRTDFTPLADGLWWQLVGDPEFVKKRTVPALRRWMHRRSRNVQTVEVFYEKDGQKYFRLMIKTSGSEIKIK